MCDARLDIFLAILDGGQEGLLKNLGEEHVQKDFMKSLTTMCGYFFFSKEHVNAMLKDVLVYKDSEERRHLVVSSLSLLLVSRVVSAVMVDLSLRSSCVN